MAGVSPVVRAKVIKGRDFQFKCGLRFPQRRNRQTFIEEGDPFIIYAPEVWPDCRRRYSVKYSTRTGRAKLQIALSSTVPNQKLASVDVKKRCQSAKIIGSAQLRSSQKMRRRRARPMKYRRAFIPQNYLWHIIFLRAGAVSAIS